MGITLEVNGRMQVNALLQCSRCLRDFSQEIVVSFKDYYSEGCTKDCYDGDELDIEQLLQEKFFLRNL